MRCGSPHSLLPPAHSPPKPSSSTAPIKFGVFCFLFFQESTSIACVDVGCWLAQAWPWFLGSAERVPPRPGSPPRSGQTPREVLHTESVGQQHRGATTHHSPLLAWTSYAGPSRPVLGPCSSRAPSFWLGTTWLSWLPQNMASSRALRPRSWRGCWEHQGGGPALSHWLRQVSEKAIHCPVVLG